MHGKNMGSLKIYTKSALNGAENLIFDKSYEVGDYWDRLELSLNNITEQFRVVIEGVVGDGELGDIGIDDISFTSGCIFGSAGPLTTVTLPPSTSTPNVCGENFKCKSDASIQCIPYDKVCNFITECDDQSDEQDCGTCDFEESACGWKDYSNDKFGWTRRQAPSLNTQGPQIDHTTSSINGHFLITQINPESSGFVNQAILLGPKLQKTSEYCKASMWIHMGTGLHAEIDFIFTNVSDYMDYTFLETLYGPLGKCLFI